MHTAFVVGATGATGRLLVSRLLDRGFRVKIVVRSPDSLPDPVKKHPKLTLTTAPILDLSDAEMSRLVADCDGVFSCLGHTLSFTGIFGQPRQLVTAATRRLCNAIKANAPAKPVKYVLMNTAGNQNRDLNEPVSFRHKFVIGLLRLLLPPHVDNERAADYLRTEIGQDDRMVEWVAVRPDNLIDEPEETKYRVYPSPIRDAIFDAGKTSRINVAHFMVELFESPQKWREWKGKMPVIYNAS